jgi:hypothetical protein
VDEGYIIKVTGPCSPDSLDAGTGPSLFPGIDVSDDEIRLEFKAVSGPERASLDVFFRARVRDDGYYDSYVADVGLNGNAMLVRLQGRADALIMAARSDLTEHLKQGDWNTLALRLDGPNIWMLLNDEVVLSVADTTFDRGGIRIRVGRDGEISDTAESAVVFRNLRISRLALESDSTPPPPQNAGATLVSDPLTEPGLFRPFQCPTGRGSGAFVDEGYQMKIAGGCSERSTAAEAAWRIPGVQFTDGEIRTEFKSIGDRERSVLSLMFRDETGEAPFEFYDVQVQSGSRNLLVLSRSGPGEAGQRDLVSKRIDGLLLVDDWNRLAVRAQGPQLSVYLNEQVVLIAQDEHYASGSIRFSVLRSGPIEDDVESTVVLRNLQISRLEP